MGRGKNRQKIEHSRSESGDGKEVQGQYKLRLPDGRTQVVTYTAGVSGYKPVVTYEGEITNVQAYQVTTDRVVTGGVYRGWDDYETTSTTTAGYEDHPTETIPFQYGYEVDGVMKNRKVQISKSESSDGEQVQGQYQVRLPDGRLQTVRYTSGKDGYVATVDYA